jgi:hypothetical protein
MSLTGAQLLTIYEAVHDKCALASGVDYVFPTSTRFRSKADYWAFVNASNNTRREIETTAINAVWIDLVRFTDSNNFAEPFVKTLSFVLTVFTESTFERLDETATPDAFNAKVALTDHAHNISVYALQSEFTNDDEIDLNDADLADCHTDRLTQIDNTQREVLSEHVPDAIGSITRLECNLLVRIC